MRPKNIDFECKIKWLKTPDSRFYSRRNVCAVLLFFRTFLVHCCCFGWEVEFRNSAIRNGFLRNDNIWSDTQAFFFLSFFNRSSLSFYFLHKFFLSIAKNYKWIRCMCVCLFVLLSVRDERIFISIILIGVLPSECITCSLKPENRRWWRAHTHIHGHNWNITILLRSRWRIRRRCAPFFSIHHY